MQKKPYPKRPPHILKDDQIYFVTARNFKGYHYLRPPHYKEILLKIIREKIEKFNAEIFAFSIADNHYHILFKLKESKNLSKLIGEINGKSSKEINEADSSINQKLWLNYFDYIIRNEADFYKHLNYIHQNPIKHGKCKNFEELIDYKFCSYQDCVSEKGFEYVNDCFERYPIKDFVCQNDLF